MQILIPISSYSPFFPKEEFYFPKPLIEIVGRPMIELVVEQLQHQFPDARFLFVIDREDSRSFSLDRTLSLLTGKETGIVERLGTTSGALCSCLLAVDSLAADQPVIIANSDQIIEEDLAEAVRFFQNQQADSGVITFDSVHPRWSYVVDNGASEVVQTFEKRVASRNAIAGFYYFASAQQFIRAAQQVILNDVQLDGLYYISSALNEIILAGGCVLHKSIASRSYHSFYAPSKVEEFERTSYAARLRENLASQRQVNVIIPAAGEGSRFAKAGWKKPKPFIDVNGRPMLDHVIQNVTPRDALVTLLLRKQHLDSHQDVAQRFQRSGHQITSVAALTEGTASTVLLARKAFDNDQPMMVANSDQLVDFDVNDYIQDCFSRRLDGSILVFRDPQMDPKWSFVKLDEDGLVTEVAEKKPISDLATVGIYLFSKGSEFISAAIDMIAANDRVNSEFYTCPVYNYMIKNGARIGIYEVPMAAMAGLGTPEDLCQFLDSRGTPASLDAPD
ncbi:MAG: glycosyltransferase family 2 protein [Synechococcaceae cyanobacterium]|nr:glycosyltransferase family 2 protein [Synechococcaceae cyanobacterium]